MRTQTILLGCALLATLCAQLPVGVAVTCVEDPTDANCVDCALAEQADNVECATVLATTEPSDEAPVVPTPGDDDNDNEEPIAETTEANDEAPPADTTEANDEDDDERGDCPCRRHRRRGPRGWRRGGLGRGRRRPGRFWRGGKRQGGWGRGDRRW